MEVDLEIYNWLKESKILTEEPEIQETGKCKIPEEIALYLENGLNFTPLIKRLHRLQNQLDRDSTPMPEINSLKEVRTPAAKLYNWKILITALGLLGINIDTDTRSLIVAGDRDIIVEVLSKIYNAEKNGKAEEILFEDSSIVSKIPTETFSQSKKSSKRASIKKPSQQRTKKKPDGSLYIETIKSDKPLEQSESCLEFLLISFCKHFSLRPKQAAGLLTQGGKYLVYVISKGLKGKHTPIVSWYSEIYGCIPHLTYLISIEEASGSIPLMLASLESGFLSKNLETVLWCCRIFSKLGSELYEQELLPPAWDWFVSETGGLTSAFKALKRFPNEIRNQLISVLVQFARNNFIELFTIQLRNITVDPVNYFQVVSDFLEGFCEIRAAKQEIVSSGIVDFWIDLALKESDPDFARSVDTRLAALNLMCDVWIWFPTVIENHEVFATEILAALKKAWRDKYKLLKFACISKAFQLLENFTSERNAYAPIVYKVITFYFLENYKENSVREFIMYNFIVLFESTANIPIGIMLEPLIKQFQVTTDIVYNTSDFDFFIAIAKHPRLTMKHAIQSMDVLGKIYMTETTFIKCAAVPFMQISARFIEGSSVREYLFRFVKYTLKVTYKLEVPNKDMKESARFQRDILLDMAQKIIKLRNEALNERILNEICEVNMQVKAVTGTNSKPLLVVLKIFGDPRDIIDSYVPKPGLNIAEDLLYSEEEVSHKNEMNFKPGRPHLGSESSMTSLNSMNILPRKRADREIERIRQNLIEKELEIKLKEEKLKSIVDKRKKILRNQVDQRKATSNSLVRAVDQKSEEAKLETHMLIDLTDSDKETISAIFKRYQRVLKLLFKKYTSTGYNHSVNKATFDSFAEKNSFLSDSEFYRLLKDQGVTTSMIALEEFSVIMKTYCHRQKKPTIKVNFSEFQDLLTQTALFIHSRPPKDMSNLHPAISVKLLFDLFRKNSSERTLPSKFYDEPDPGFGDREVVKRLNLMLETDENSELPEGYKKVVESEVAILYEVPAGVEAKESLRIGVSVLDDLLEKLFGVHILEPVIQVRRVVRARGVLAKPLVQPENNLSSEVGSKFNLSSTGITYHKAVYQPSLPAELNLTPEIKYGLARLSGKYPNDSLTEAAKLLDDLIHTVDSGSSVLISRNNRTKIVNKAVLAKEENLNRKKEEDELKEQRRKLRSQIIEEKLQKANENKKNRQKEENKKKLAEKERKKEALRRNEERWKEELERKENELKEWRAKKKLESEKHKAEEEHKKLVQAEERKKKIEEFKEKQKAQKAQEVIEKPSERKVTEVEDKKKAEGKKKHLEKIIQKDKGIMEENKKNEEKIKSIIASAEFQEYIGGFNKSLDLVFSHYSKVAAQGTANSGLVFVGFNKFCTSFDICPGILQLDDCLKVFRTITKSKPTGGAIALDLTEFKESLLRISILAKYELEKVLNEDIPSDFGSIKALLKYLKLTVEVKNTRDLIQSTESRNNKSRPREKKLTKVNKSFSRELTPLQSDPRSKSTTKK